MSKITTPVYDGNEETICGGCAGFGRTATAFYKRSRICTVCEGRGWTLLKDNPNYPSFKLQVVPQVTSAPPRRSNYNNGQNRYQPRPSAPRTEEPRRVQPPRSGFNIQFAGA